MKELPKVTFGYVNCNRLLYLKSAVESLLHCTDDYPNKEVIVIDNASDEEGTSEYLDYLEDAGHQIIRNTHRDPKNEFARGINTIIEKSSGDYICIMQGDSQFNVKDKWLHEYVKFYEANPNAGCIMLDAQRTIRNKRGNYSQKFGDQYKFVYDGNRFPTSGAGRVMYSKKVIDILYPWSTENDRHEGGGDSEEKARAKITRHMSSTGEQFYCAMPIVPVTLGIYTDPRGANARVTATGRIGEYWAPKKDFRYYEVHDYDQLMAEYGDREIPCGIEEMAIPIGFDAPLDEDGNWKKNPPKLDR
mgnify:CR=1 FL=1|jgi:glycosyltransferase involved in cell wall biosynthesis